MKILIITIATLLNNYNHQQWELYQAIADVEDYIEWTNEDLFQGNITEEEHEVKIENYEITLKRLKECTN